MSPRQCPQENRNLGARVEVEGGVKSEKGGGSAEENRAIRAGSPHSSSD